MFRGIEERGKKEKCRHHAFTRNKLERQFRQHIVKGFFCRLRQMENNRIEMYKKISNLLQTEHLCQCYMNGKAFVFLTCNHPSMTAEYLGTYKIWDNSKDLYFYIQMISKYWEHTVCSTYSLKYLWIHLINHLITIDLVPTIFKAPCIWRNVHTCLSRNFINEFINLLR